MEPPGDKRGQGRGNVLVAGKGGGTGKSGVWVKDVEGAVHSICSRLINGSDSAPVSDYSCLIFRHPIHTYCFTHFFLLLCDIKEPVSAKGIK